jgi:hypothetical protein
MEKKEDDGEFVEVCDFAEISTSGSRKRVVAKERDITIFNLNGELSAMDSVCYRMRC